LFGAGEAAGRVIFASKEIGLVEDPAADTEDQLQGVMNRTGHTGEFAVLTPEEADERVQWDASSRLPVLLALSGAVLWLVLASVFGLVASMLTTWMIPRALDLAVTSAVVAIFESASVIGCGALLRCSWHRAGAIGVRWFTHFLALPAPAAGPAWRTEPSPRRPLNSAHPSPTPAQAGTFGGSAVRARRVPPFNFPACPDPPPLPPPRPLPAPLISRPGSTPRSGA